MVRIFALLMLCWPALAAPVPKPAQVPSVAGTTWAGRTVWGGKQSESLKLTFQEGGKLICENGTIPIDNYPGTWEQIGDTVEWNINNYAFYKGTVNGAKIEGAGYNHGKLTVTFTFTRLETKP